MGEMIRDRLLTIGVLEHESKQVHQEWGWGERTEEMRKQQRLAAPQMEMWEGEAKTKHYLLL